MLTPVNAVTVTHTEFLREEQVDQDSERNVRSQVLRKFFSMTPNGPIKGSRPMVPISVPYTLPDL